MIAGSGGFYYSCRIALWAHHIRMDSEKSKDSQSEALIILKFSTSEVRNLHWKRKNIEFEYQGEYYDLKYSETVNGKSYFFCHLDQAEKKMIARMHRQSTGRNNQHRNPAFITLSPFIEPHTILPGNQEGILLNYYSVCGPEIARFTELEAPPPKLN